MNTQKVKAISGIWVVIALFIIVVFVMLTSSCSKKVLLDVNKTSDKSKTEESATVKTNSVATENTKIETKQNSSDSSKIAETETTEITADSIITDNHGNTLFKGHAKLKQNKRKDTAINKKDAVESLKTSANTKSASKDSVGKKAVQLDQKDFSKKKQVVVKGFSWWFVFLIGLLGLIVFMAVKWDWISKTFIKLFLPIFHIW